MKDLSSKQRTALFLIFTVILALWLVYIQKGRHDDGNYTYVYEKDYATEDEFHKAIKDALTDDVDDAVYTVFVLEPLGEEYENVPYVDENLSNPTEPITKYLFNKLQGGEFDVDESVIEDTSDTTPFIVDASKYKSDAHLKATISSALEVFDSVTVTNFVPPSNTIIKSDEDYAISTKHVYAVAKYEAKNVKDLGLTFEGDSVDGDTSSPKSGRTKTLITGIDVYNSIKLFHKSLETPYAFSMFLFGPQIEAIHCTGSWQVPVTHNNKQVKKATLQTREVVDNKQVDIYKKGSNTIDETVNIERLNGINFYKVFEYK